MSACLMRVGSTPSHFHTSSSIRNLELLKPSPISNLPDIVCQIPRFCTAASIDDYLLITFTKVEEASDRLLTIRRLARMAIDNHLRTYGHRDRSPFHHPVTTFNGSDSRLRPISSIAPLNVCEPISLVRKSNTGTASVTTNPFW